MTMHRFEKIILICRNNFLTLGTLLTVTFAALLVHQSQQAHLRHAVLIVMRYVHGRF